MAFDPACNYCTQSPGLAAVMAEVADLPHSRVYLWRDGHYPGRCVVALNEHVRELFDLEAWRRNAFLEDVARVAAAIHAGFGSDKINYAVYGDTVPHLHFHLVPKREGGPEWGGPFLIKPPAEPLTDDEIDRFRGVLRTGLGLPARCEAILEEF